MTNRLCESCGKDIETFVCSAPYASFSFATCKQCHLNDIYPYRSLLVQCWAAGGWDKCSDWFQGLIEHNIKFRNKTLLEFKKDLESINNEN
jgi:hypothetical protein